MVTEVKDNKKVIFWIIVGVLIFIVLINQILIGGNSNDVTNETIFKEIVQKAEVIKVNSLLNPEITNYNFTTLPSSLVFENQELNQTISNLCGSIDHYPENISILVVDSGILIINSASYEILCDYVFPSSKEEYNTKLEENKQKEIKDSLNTFPKVAEDDKYKITLISITKNKVGETVWLNVHFESENKITGKIMPNYSAGLSFEDCMSYSVFFVDLSTNSYFMIHDTVSRCGRSIRYNDKTYTYENGTRVYLKDIQKPMKLVITTYRPLSVDSDQFFKEVKEGRGEDLYIFDVDVSSIPET